MEPIARSSEPKTGPRRDTLEICFKGAHRPGDTDGQVSLCSNTAAGTEADCERCERLTAATLADAAFDTLVKGLTSAVRPACVKV